MKGEIACHSCDLIVSVASLQHGETASCSRCGCYLTRYREDAAVRALAFSSASLIFLVLANSYSFLSFTSNGLGNVITLGQTPLALWQNGMPEIALLVSAFILVIPSAILLMLVALCVPLSQGEYHPWLSDLAKGVIRFQNWAMVEVFIIGVIVSLVKLAEIATVVLGISFWAYVGFSICFILALSSLDRYQCFEEIERLRTQQTS